MSNRISWGRVDPKVLVLFLSQSSKPIFYIQVFGIVLAWNRKGKK